MRDGADPRLDGDAFAINAAQPVVGRQTGQASGALIVGAFALLAVVLFLALNAHRNAADAASLISPAPQGSSVASPPPPPLQLGPPPALPPASPPPLPVPHVEAVVVPPASPLLLPPSTPDPMARRRAPSVVVDLGLGTTELAPTPVVTGALSASESPAGAAQITSSTSPAPVQARVASPAGGPPIPAAILTPVAATQNNLATTAQFGGSAEQFARRIGEEEPNGARATVLPNLGSLVSQGTVIPGVLETAIDSDLPGFTRAIVSRDVRNFDGKSVLIPRGSRLIGQYRSAVALGDTRAFVIWTRIIRPDGASILIGSPGGDALGRGGLDGEVDRHFFARFGGSILLSVLNAGVAAIGGVAATQVTIGSPGAAIGAASSVTGSDPIAPTIKVPQGATIRIFVARDLDFSGVGPVK
jgi:type IV secretory pathway VirB10-like protein